MPEIVFAHLDEAFGRTEPDEEIQDLLKASIGLNLALHYLQGAITFDPAIHRVDAALASKIVWLDCLLTNVDRSFRNTNMLVWNKELWLIDHGASLYFHHNWKGWKESATRPFSQVKDHVLLRQASELQQADEVMKQLLTEEKISHIVALVPEEWLRQSFDESATEVRKIYTDYLVNRIKSSQSFVNEAIDARKQLV